MRMKSPPLEKGSMSLEGKAIIPSEFGGASGQSNVVNNWQSRILSRDGKYCVTKADPMVPPDVAPLGDLHFEGGYDYPWLKKLVLKGETHDQINRRGLRLGRHNVSTGNASCAGSRAGQHDHSSGGRMRGGHDTS
jgi:hypothetical protein